MAQVQDNRTLAADLGLDKLPHFTTLQKAERRLVGADRVRRLIAHRAEAASDIDSTGACAGV